MDIEINPFSQDAPERLNPKTAEVALCFQLYDSLRVCYAMAHYNVPAFKNALHSLSTHIEVYQQTRDEKPLTEPELKAKIPQKGKTKK